MIDTTPQTELGEPKKQNVFFIFLFSNASFTVLTFVLTLFFFSYRMRCSHNRMILIELYNNDSYDFEI